MRFNKETQVGGRALGTQGDHVGGRGKAVERLKLVGEEVERPRSSCDAVKKPRLVDVHERGGQGEA